MKKLILGLVLSAALSGSNVSAFYGQETLKNAWGKTSTHVENHKGLYIAGTSSLASVAAISAFVAYDLKHDAKILKVAVAAKVLTVKKYNEIKSYMKTNPKKAAMILTPVIVTAILGGAISADCIYNRGFAKSYTKASWDKVIGLFVKKTSVDSGKTVLESKSTAPRRNPVRACRKN